MSDLDPHLANLLRQAPAAPQALDSAHRQAVLAAARQTWFRQRARTRRNVFGLAAAAVLAAAVAGWTLRSLSDTPAPAAPAVVAGKQPAVPIETAAALAAPAAASSPAPQAAADAMSFAAADKNPLARPMAADAPTVPMRSLQAKARLADRGVLEIPADAPRRGQLLLAAAALEAALNHRLQPDERAPALQAALDLIAGIAHPAADELRRRLLDALTQH